MEQDILVNPQEKELLINKLKSVKFEEFEVHSHFYNKQGRPRHGIGLGQAKKIFEKFDKIISVSKRRKPDWFTYSFIYKINSRTSYYLIFILDEKPIKIFDVYCCGKNIEKRLYKKYGFRPRYLFCL